MFNFLCLIMFKLVPKLQVCSQQFRKMENPPLPKYSFPTPSTSSYVLAELRILALLGASLLYGTQK
jgi:hypothetical protein